MASLSALQSRC